MIITKTPFRVSFAGGGTDLKAFYDKEPGAVVSTSINKYMFITVNKFFEPKIILKYSATELVDHFQQIKHPLIREAFNKTETSIHTEMTSLADIPSVGSGLGSSSAFTVGLLKALYSFKNLNKNNLVIAKEACEIEIDRLGEPIGKQDQYACAVGGLNLIQFNSDDTVFVEPISLTKSYRNDLQDNLLLFYTGITRSASSILTEQKRETSKEDKFQLLCKMRDLAYELRDSMHSADLSAFGTILHKNWLLKKSLTSNISTNIIDSYYDKGISLGASGGKILGAGGGGFLLFYCEKDKQENLINNLGLRHVPFRFDPQGSRIIYMEDHNE
jgi:D-glycero-alpha-D-manno-heptose-7-phosphate kinase